MNDVAQWVLAAEERIRPLIRQTYLQHSPYFTQASGANVYFKCENLQHTGSFKVRGALNKVLSLTDAERARGVITASTGNHGAAVAYALGSIGASGTVCVPDSASPAKLDNMRRLGAKIHVVEGDPVEAENFGRQHAQENGLTFISPYNDAAVVGGQGTIGVELMRQLDHIDAVLIALGGGGLISGISGYLKAVAPHVQIIGCSPRNSQVMFESIQAGQILDLPSLSTLSDGTAGGVEAGAITFDLCREYVDGYISVSEDEIAAAMRSFMGVHHMLIEGAAAVPLAALLQQPDRFTGQNVVIVLCGANISLDKLKQVL